MSRFKICLLSKKCMIKKYKKILKDTILVICARKGSKGIKNKNIIQINKKPLIQYAFDKANKIAFPYTCLSTDSEIIRDISKKNKFKSFFKRPKRLCKNSVPKIEVWKHSILESQKYYKKKFKYIIDIEVTNPLTTNNDFAKFIEKFLSQNKNINGQICGNLSFKNPYFNILEKKNGKFDFSKKIGKKILTSRQQAPNTYDNVAAFYIFKTSYILKSTTILDGKISLYNLPFYKSFDLDDNEDLILIKKLLKK